MKRTLKEKVKDMLKPEEKTWAGQIATKPVMVEVKPAPTVKQEETKPLGEIEDVVRALQAKVANLTVITKSLEIALTPVCAPLVNETKDSLLPTSEVPLAKTLIEILDTLTANSARLSSINERLEL